MANSESSCKRVVAISMFCYVSGQAEIASGEKKAACICRAKHCLDVGNCQ